MASKMINISAVAEFDNLLNEKKSNLLVCHFWAEWAPQCQQIMDVLDTLAKDKELKDVVFVKIEAENLQELSKRYNVASVPTCVLFWSQNVVERLEGANVPELTKKVKQQASKASLLSMAKCIPPSVPANEDINTKLKRLVNSSPCIIFMKGTSEEPKCGFSKQAVEILNKYNADYKTFDVLTNEEVRQGLKAYSNWPTYPQLYVKGELVGGLDILKEMDSSGDLDSSLPKKQQNVEERLKTLTNRSPLMIFMKGNPEAPRCGFSKTLIAILNETGIKYDTFDILEDEEVRQELKVFSNWPTYPQIYVKGNLIGGLDIIKELKEAGELEPTLKGEDS